MSNLQFPLQNVKGTQDITRPSPSARSECQHLTFSASACARLSDVAGTGEEPLCGWRCEDQRGSCVFVGKSTLKLRASMALAPNGNGAIYIHLLLIQSNSNEVLFRVVFSCFTGCFFVAVLAKNDRVSSCPMFDRSATPRRVMSNLEKRSLGRSESLPGRTPDESASLAASRRSEKGGRLEERGKHMLFSLFYISLGWPEEEESCNSQKHELFSLPDPQASHVGRWACHA